VDFGALLLPAALVFGAPESLGTYQKGLFCESVQLIEHVAALAERGANPFRVVEDFNERARRRVCVYADEPEVRGNLVRVVKVIMAAGKHYSIYQTEVSSLGMVTTEVGAIEWRFSAPIIMYTLRVTDPIQAVRSWRSGDGIYNTRKSQDRLPANLHR
jgi:hypothetical protein